MAKKMKVFKRFDKRDKKQIFRTDKGSILVGPYRISEFEEEYDGGLHYVVEVRNVTTSWGVRYSPELHHYHLFDELIRWSELHNEEPPEHVLRNAEIICSLIYQQSNVKPDEEYIESSYKSLSQLYDRYEASADKGSDEESEAIINEMKHVIAGDES